jgi:very-short-patch-repair endonuclease
VLLAKILAVGGAACGASAAALYGLVPFPRTPEIILPRTASVRPRGSRLTDSLPPSDLTVVDGIRATRPARTIIELATTMPRDRFEDVLDGAIVGKLVTMDRLEKRARELGAPNRPGCAVVLALLAQRHPELGRARNEMEARVLRALDRLHAPRPRVNLPVILRGERRIIDFAWEEPRIALELDGFVPHSTRRVFDDDRVRRNLFTAEGWRMYHVTRAALQRSSRDALALVLEALDVDPG